MAEALEGKFFWESTTKYEQSVAPEVGEIRHLQKKLRAKSKPSRYEPVLDLTALPSPEWLQTTSVRKFIHLAKLLESTLTKMYDVTREDIHGKSKKMLPCFVRNFMMWLLRRYHESASFTRIGRYFKRDHSTVISNVQKFDRDWKLYEDAVLKIDEIVGYVEY